MYGGTNPHFAPVGLGRRIEERFPSHGISKICKELYVVAKESKSKSEWITKPNYWLRIVAALVVLISLATLFYSVTPTNITPKNFHVGELVQITEAGINTIVLIGAVIFFLVTIEVRIKLLPA